jgi:NADH:ubiquinone oxidoreductase subunit E
MKEGGKLSEETTTILSTVDKAFKKFETFNPLDSALIPLLQDIQAETGYLPEAALKRVANRLKMPESRVFGVATFYHQFRLRPIGKHIITVCGGTACHVGGADTNQDFLVRHLKLRPLEDTTDDGLFTVYEVRCIGCCSLAPVIKVDDDVYGRVNTSRIPRILSTYRRRA